MIGLIQRVTSASVSVEQEVIGDIEKGILVFLGIQKTDSEQDAYRLLKKILNYRIFPDVDRKMNLSLVDIKGELLIISQFTLAAETAKGLRPSFSSAAPPDHAKELYNYFLSLAKLEDNVTQSGLFGADMKVTLTNDGPVTFLLTT
jgi:D-tyrosyl-tRNA(Tyr) deacylase